MDSPLPGQAMTGHQPAPTFNGSFPHHWQAEILPVRRLILPARHFVYPREAEEVERGALEVLIRPGSKETDPSPELAAETTNPVKGTSERIQVKGTGERIPVKGTSETNPMKGTSETNPVKGTSERIAVKGTGFSPYIDSTQSTRALAPEGPLAGNRLPAAQEFLATCALGFRDPAVPTGLWSTPNPEEICALSGGYAYIIDTTAPERFSMIEYRPVLQVLPQPAQGLLLFIGHHSILAWGVSGQAWQSEKLSSEGITLEDVHGPILHGLGWDLMTDKETPFALDLRSGLRIPKGRA